MSRYLIRRIEETPAIVFRPHTAITALEGGDHLERVRWRDKQTGTSETHDIRHVFAMTGAVPNTRWIEGCVALDAQGFIKTGSDLSRRIWPPRVGRSPGLPTSLKRVCPACSRSATSGEAISSAWPRPSARARLRSPSCIRCSTNRRKIRTSPWTSASSAQDVWPKPSHAMRYTWVTRLKSATAVGRTPLGGTVHTLGSGVTAVTTEEEAAASALVVLAVPWDDVVGALTHLPPWQQTNFTFHRF